MTLNISIEFSQLSDLETEATRHGWISKVASSRAEGKIYTWERNRSCCAIFLKFIAMSFASCLLVPFISEEFRNHWKSVFSKKEIKQVYLKTPLPSTLASPVSDLSLTPAIVTTPAIATSSQALTPVQESPVVKAEEGERKEEASLVKQKMIPDIAASIIGRAWRTHRIRQARLLQKSALCSSGMVKQRSHHLITVQESWLIKWHEMTIEKFLSHETEAEIDATVKDLVGRNDRRALRRFASALFAGAFSRYMFCLCPDYMKLVNNFSGDRQGREQLRISTEEMGRAIKNVYHYLKPKISNFSGSVPEYTVVERDGEERLVRISAAEKSKLSQEMGELRMKKFRISDIFSAHLPDPDERLRRIPLSIDPEKEVWIIHGGGFDNICNFLAGRTLGYRLEEGSVPGMQVHPCEKLREVPRVRLLYYANRGAARSLDRPCIFSAKIKAKYLDKAPNSYEAGLRSNFLRFLTDIHIEPLPLKAEILKSI